MRDADLRGPKLDGADLTGADVTGAPEAELSFHLDVVPDRYGPSPSCSTVVEVGLAMGGDLNDAVERHSPSPFRRGRCRRARRPSHPLAPALAAAAAIAVSAVPGASAATKITAATDALDDVCAGLQVYGGAESLGYVVRSGVGYGFTATATATATATGQIMGSYLGHLGAGGSDDTVALTAATGCYTPPDVAWYTDSLPAYAPVRRSDGASVDGTSFREWGRWRRRWRCRWICAPGIDC